MQITIRRFLTNVPIPTVVGYGFYVGFTGDIPLAEKPMGDLLGELDGYLYTNFEQPVIFLVSLGIAVSWLGYWVFRLVSRSAKKKEKLEKYRGGFEEIGNYKIDFFRLLRRAYSKYRNNVLNHGYSLAFYVRLNEHFNIFIDDAEYPKWLDGKSDDLATLANSNVDQSDPIWNFVVCIYREIEDQRRPQYSPLFEDGEALEFHRVRQKLSYFFDNVGKDISNGLLRTKDIKEELSANHRVVKFLCFISVVLICLNRQRGSGAKDLFALGKLLEKECPVENI